MLKLILLFLRRVILAMLRPALKICGKLHLRIPHEKRWLTSSEKYIIAQSVMPGDVLLTRSRQHFSNLLIPGKFWTHAALVSKDGKNVCEAVDPTVRLVCIEDFIADKDFLTIQRCKETTAREAQEAATYFEGAFLGLPYDYFFEPSVTAMYCAEGVVLSYRHTVPEEICTPHFVLGVETFLPASFWRDHRWEEVFTSRSYFCHGPS